MKAPGFAGNSLPLLPADRRRGAAALVVPGPGNAQDMAEESHGEHLGVLVDPGALYRLSLAKYAAAFYKDGDLHLEAAVFLSEALELFGFGQRLGGGWQTPGGPAGFDPILKGVEGHAESLGGLG